MIKIDDIPSWKAWKEALWKAAGEPVEYYYAIDLNLKLQPCGLRKSPKDGQFIVPDPWIENVWLEREDFYWSEKLQKWSDTTQRIFIYKDPSS